MKHLILLSLSFVFSLSWADTKNSSSEKFQNLELFQKVLQFVEKNYVDPVSSEQLVHGAIKGMLETLDPHSNFLTGEVYRDLKIDTAGKFGGVGIEVGIKDDVLTVLAPMEDSPAWKAGIQAGDKIVKINGVSTKGFTLSEAVSQMRGKDGSNVELVLYRKGWDKFRTFVLKRQTIKIKSVKYERLSDGMGYVRLASFHETAAQDVKNAIETMSKKEPLRGLVFDLRTNPGGLLDQAVDVSSLFIDEGVIVSTIGRDPSQKEVRSAKKGMAKKDLPLVILVNGSTASAAEIVAAALQDHRRAMILGETTFGKGSVQSIIELGNELGLKLTVARYYSPKGTSIQEKGVEPDILLDEYDPKLLQAARIKRETPREKDLKRHLKSPDPKTTSDDFSLQEFKQGPKNKNQSAENLDDSDLLPNRFDPKDDFQVQEAIKYLKSFELFRKLKTHE